MPVRSLRIFLVTFLFAIFSISFVTAQDSTETNVRKGSYFKFSLSYLSNSVSYGRKDSLAVSYLTPAIEYRDKSGLYFEGSLSYLTGTGSQIDGADVTAGYDFDSRNGKLSGGLYASKYFTSSSSYSVRSEVKGAAGGSLDYNLGPVSLSAGTDLSFSNKMDIVLNFGVSRQFELNDKRWAIAPSAVVNAGTQNFYQDYLTKRKYSQRRRRRAGSTPAAVNVIVINKSFAILDYELSSPINYDGHKWGLFFTPTYSIPENGFKYSLNNGATYQSQKLSNTFYAEVGAYIKF
jgi:hypothetical protein